LEENVEAKVDKYNLCHHICEFLLFRNSFRFTYFKIVQKNDTIEESKENGESQLSKNVADMLQNNFPFDLLLELSQKEEYKKQFNQIKNNITITEYDTPAPNDLDLALKKFQAVVSKRIHELKEKIEMDFSE